MLYEDLDVMLYEPSWFNLSWGNRIPVTVNSSQVPSTQNDFPLLINSIFTNLIGAVEAELRFAGVDNVLLDYEIQKFDSLTGELIAWVKKPTISDGEITYIYYDNPGALDAQNPTAVWDANYKSVYHMQNNADDSTVNAQNMTNFGTVLTPVTGKIGDAADYGGTVNDYSIRNPFSGFPSTQITAEYWIQTTGTSDGMISYAVGSTTPLANHFLVFTQNILSIWIAGVIQATLLSFNDGVFHHIVVTWRSSDGQLIVYIDGVNSFSIIHQLGASFTANGSLVLGQDQDNLGGGFEGGMSLNGILDEVRLSDNFRDADYVTTTYNNQSNPSAFYSISANQTVPVPMGYEN